MERRRQEFKVREVDVQRAILAYLDSRGIFAWRNNNHATFDRKHGAFRKHVGLAGVSDILMILPGGRFGALEVKGTKGYPSAEQKAFIERVKAEGGVAGVVRSIEDVEELLSPY